MQFPTVLYKHIKSFIVSLLRCNQDPNLIPQHLAIIMDGNRRFARKLHRPISEGHSAGFDTLQQILDLCMQLNVKCVTVYAFSVDNFRRSREEVDDLMALFKSKLQELAEHSQLVQQYQVRIRILGQLDLLSDDVRRAAEECMQMTAGNTGPILNVCCPYSSKLELQYALSKLSDYDQNSNTKTIESEFQQQLMTKDSPELDLLIRTSGETRLSDFMLWQSTNYRCQVRFTDTLWPEFGFWDFVLILIGFAFVRYMQGLTGQSGPAAKPSDHLILVHDKEQ